MTMALVAANDNVRQFYVYQHRRNDTGEVFYVGKGSRGRAWLKVRRNPYWTNIVDKHGRAVEILCDGLDEDFAFLLESELIAKIGRHDIGSGPLANMTNGGEGASGFIANEETRAKLRARPRAPLSQEAKDKISAANRGRIKSVETRQKLSIAHTGRRVSEETKAKLRIASSGKRHTEEAKSKIGRANSGKKRTTDQNARMGDARRGVPLSNNSSGYVNVYFVTNKNRWAAKLPCGGKKIPGYYKTAAEAAQAMDLYVDRHRESV